MKVATWQGGSRFSVDEAAEPTPGAGQVVVEVRTAGICGTDVHATQGLFPWTPPLVMGHEYSGVIVDVGARVARSLIGRAVACEPGWGCGECSECLARRVSHCLRLTRAGGFAERVVLPVRAVHALPEGLEPVTAAMTEPAACCLASLETFHMPKGATVLVLGGGIMGLLTLAIAKHRGAAHAILSDPIAERRDVARRLGADHVIDPAGENLRDRVLGLTNGRGADVGCEAVGKPALVAETMALVKPKGIVLLVGVSPKGQPLPIDLYDFHYRELSLHCAYGRGTSFRRALALMPALDVSALVTARFPLNQIEEAFAHAAAGRGVKTVLTPSPAL
ncbi:MAG TPA: alcohol dehydrogenase catalytic domain-containing protein [Candidatus Methylomirabilis sp.]|nr:alcohol dehydrogenase catalytic domain-containing protein [Candidatus Methylomirabilis sp.]